MIEDYQRYLCYLRNNLIQNNVGFPLYPLEGYRDLLILGSQLDNMLYYYSILAISGSEDAINYCIPLGSYYKQLMRQEFYSDWLKFQPQYHKISKAYLLSNKDIVLRSELSSDDEEISLFEESKESEDKGCTEHGTYIEDLEWDDSNSQESGNSDESLEGTWDDFFSTGNEDYSEHGTYIEDLVFEEPTKRESWDDLFSSAEESKEPDIDEDSNYIDHGTYIEDLVFNEKAVEELEIEIEEGYVPHGTYIEDLVFEGRTEEEDFADGINIDEDAEEEEGVFDYYEEEEEITDNSQQEAVEGTSCTSEKVSFTPDLSDYIQDVTNSILTKGRDFIKGKK